MAEFHCTFCGKSKDDVKKLIAGPMVFICDGCVGLCNDILDDKDVARPFDQSPPLPFDVSGEQIAHVRLRSWELLTGWGETNDAKEFKTWNYHERTRRAEKLAQWAWSGRLPD